MRILLVTNYQPPHMGGIEYAAVSLRECWRRLGHEVVWLTTDLPPRAVSSSSDNLRVPAANFLERKWQINTPLVNPCFLPLIGRAIDSCDVVNTHSLAPGLASLTMVLALLKNKPVVATQHIGVIPFANKMLDLVQKKILCSLARWGVKRGMKLTFVGEAVRQWFVRNAGLHQAETIMTPAGIDRKIFNFVGDDERKAFRLKWSLAEDRLNILFVGRFYEKKGLSLIRQLAENFSGMKFTLVGQGPILPATWRLDNVRVVGYVSNAELRELYGAHDLFVMPSVGEGWPAVVPQAMACGLPCLISEETFAGYDRDRDMFVVCPRDRVMLGKTLAAMAADSSGLITRRMKVSEYARTHWDWETTAGIYVELFRKLVAR